MGFNELSMAEWLGIGIAVLFAFGIVMGFSAFMMSAFNDKVQDVDYFTDGTKSLTESQTAKTFTLIDNMFLGFFIGMAIATVLVARASFIHPFWWVFLLIVLILLSIVAAQLANSFVEFNEQGELLLEQRLPKMNHILSNFMVYVLVVGFTALYMSRNGGSGL